MSQTVIFSVGVAVFALTIWGAVMAGGIWLGQIAQSEAKDSAPGPAYTDRGSDEVGGTPRTTSQ